MPLTSACVQHLAPALVAHRHSDTPSRFWRKPHNEQLQRRPWQSLSAARLSTSSQLCPASAQYLVWTLIRSFTLTLRQKAMQQRKLSITAAQKQQFSSFDDMVRNSDLPVLVDFYATWCGPCQMLAGVLTTVGSQLSDKVKIVKIDTDKYPKLASRYRIQALPTMVVFQNGQQVDRIEGNDAGRMCMNAQLLVDRLQSKLSFNVS